jgi:hypothetical protein
MARETILVAAAFEKSDDAEAAVADLDRAGFWKGDISVMYTDKAHMAEQGVISGALFGGVVGGLVGLLFPPAGMIIAAGPILGALASAIGTGATLAVATGAVSGLASVLIQIGMPREMADRFGGQIHKGDTLVVVHTAPDLAPKAHQVLEAHNPRAETDTGGTLGTVSAPAQTSQAGGS